MRRLLVRAWRALRPVQWRLLWFAHAKFMVGVTGVVRDEQGRVLLLKHRFWPEGRQWGLPGGWAKKAETFEDTLVREVREETGLDIRVTGLAYLRSGYRLRAEVAFEAVLTGGSIAIDSFEVLEARWFAPDDLPPGVREPHLALINGHPC
ncbi:NUDIX hydrolase [Sphaerisporangium melleum]|uniref:NUDIX hydrolase n=1 Tax=Sphaerisporangium melleum TaxID=321316 RepID=A0A917VDC2_9ACTN|nr:NUDIX domain-containing protein [Sphaerisporangium melleum]GGK64864.1 NUDIX hydrolase [Sphaerisporangium melleum]GII70027.1 NUDIX hydrolase [Sphaerisporangium melleum]